MKYSVNWILFDLDVLAGCLVVLKISGGFCATSSVSFCKTLPSGNVLDDACWIRMLLDGFVVNLLTYGIPT